MLTSKIVDDFYRLLISFTSNKNHPNIKLINKLVVSYKAYLFAAVNFNILFTAAQTDNIIEKIQFLKNNNVFPNTIQLDPILDDLKSRGILFFALFECQYDAIAFCEDINTVYNDSLSLNSETFNPILIKTGIINYEKKKILTLQSIPLENNNMEDVEEKDIKKLNDDFYHVICVKSVNSYNNKDMSAAFELVRLLIQVLDAYSSERKDKIVNYYYFIGLQCLQEAKLAAEANDYEKAKMLSLSAKTVNEDLLNILLRGRNGSPAEYINNIFASHVNIVCCEWKLIESSISQNPILAFQKISQLLIQLNTIPITYHLDLCEKIEFQLLSLCPQMENIDKLVSLQCYISLINELQTFERYKRSDNVTLECFKIRYIQLILKFADWACEFQDAPIAKQLLSIVMKQVNEVDFKKINALNHDVLIYVLSDYIFVHTKFGKLYVNSEKKITPINTTPQQMQTSSTSLPQYANLFFLQRKRYFSSVLDEKSPDSNKRQCMQKRPGFLTP